MAILCDLSLFMTWCLVSKEEHLERESQAPLFIWLSLRGHIASLLLYSIECGGHKPWSDAKRKNAEPTFQWEQC